MAAVVRAVFNGTVTITSDGFVLIGGFANEFIGAIGDVERNWTNLLDAAGLTDEEYSAAEALYVRAITDWRPRARLFALRTESPP